MYMQRLILFLLFFLCFESNAQSIRGLVLDNETNEPIPYASVYLSSFKSGVYASENGMFELKYDSPDDTIIVSVIGYTSYQSKIADMELSGNSIFLEPKAIELAEVVVTPSMKKKKMIRLGARNNLNKRWEGVFTEIKTDGSLSLNVEHCLFIDGLDVPVVIKKVIVACSIKGEQLEALFRVRFYTKDPETNEPDQIKNKKDIVKGFTLSKSKTITFDIENEHIIHPSEGQFVSFEHIGYRPNSGVDSLGNNYNIMSVDKTNNEMVRIGYVKSKEGAIAGVKFHGFYYMPFEGNENFFSMEKQMLYLFIQLEVEVP